MWGLTTRFGQDRVQHSVPAWLLNAGATYDTIRYVDDVVAELRRDPVRYDYDPAARYTAFIQTWDTAWHNMPSLAFGRRRVGESLVELMPDPYFIGHRGYARIRQAATAVPPWHVREPHVGWRGSVTGAAAPSIEAIPRIALALACRDIPGTDVKLFGVHPTMDNSFEPGTIAAFLSRHDLHGDRWYMPAFAGFRYVLDIDGYANAWGFLEKLILGCCVLKVGSVFEQWFYDRLQPWVHYVPVRGDLADLREVIDWCYAHDEQCAWIAGNAARAAAAMRFEDEVPRSCRALLSVACMEPPSRPLTLKPDRDRLVVRPLATALALEASGQFGLAIVEYDRLAQAGQGGGATFRRKALLHREEGEYVLAMAAMRRIEQFDPFDWATMHAHARIASGLGQEHVAAKLLFKAIETVPDGNEEVRVDLVAVCLRLDWVDLAASLAIPLAVGPGHWWGSLRDEALDRFAAYRREAVDLLARRRADGHLSLASQVALARRLAALGRLRPARWLVEAVGKDSEAGAAADVVLARIVQRLSGTGAALAQLRAALPERRLSSEYVLALAKTLHEEGQFDQVVPLLDERTGMEQSFEVRFFRAAALLALGRGDELRRHCARWLELVPEDHPAGLAIAGHPSLRTTSGLVEGVNLVQYHDAAEMPAALSASFGSWSRLNPGLRVSRFDRTSALEYLRSGLGQDAAAAFDRCREERDRADLLKYAFLHREGGVYVDARERCAAPMAPVIASFADADIGAICSEDVLAYVHDFFVGARAGSKVIEQFLTSMIADLHDRDRDGGVSWAGPWSSHRRMTQIVGRHLARTQCPGEVKLLRFGRYRRMAMRDDGSGVGSDFLGTNLVS